MHNKLFSINIVVMDVDGVLTDGTFSIDDNGCESKTFNTQDGAGIKYLHRAGLKTAIITGRKSKAVEFRATELGIKYVYQQSLNKLEALEELLSIPDLDCSYSTICYIGDDLTDMPVMKRVAFPVATANAREEVKNTAVYITKNPGGYGAVREVVELILKGQNKWQNIIARYCE